MNLDKNEFLYANIYKKDFNVVINSLYFLPYVILKMARC